MNKTQIFPVMLMVLDLGASVMCGMENDWKKAIYWFAAAVLSYTVTF